MKKIIVAAAIAASTLTSVTPVFAQDASSIVASCAAAPADCAALVAAALASLSEADANALIGSISAGLVEAAKANPALASGLGDALSSVASLSTDPEQQVALADVANAVSSGNAGDVDTGPIGSSPN